MSASCAEALAAPVASAPAINSDLRIFMVSGNVVIRKSSEILLIAEKTTGNCH